MYQTTSTTIIISGNTGALCPRTGPYKSTRNAGAVLTIKRGTQFPPDTDGASTTWRLTLETQTATYQATM